MIINSTNKIEILVCNLNLEINTNFIETYDFMIMMNDYLKIIAVGSLLFSSIHVAAQERVVPLMENIFLNNQLPNLTQQIQSTVILTLPFFEDFTDNNVYPNQNRWIDSNVYINNTFGKDMISRGVATFDALNKYGVPYDTINANTTLRADSLTSGSFDLSNKSSNDSIYLSFYYQPQGNGFAPKMQDSLILMYKNSQGIWRQMWSIGGSNSHNFTKVFIPISDTSFLHDNFQFKFVNIATIGNTNSHWNLDYIQLAEDINPNTTTLNDVAVLKINGQPKLLKEYTVMPIRHFNMNKANYWAANYAVDIRNNKNITQNISIIGKTFDQFGSPISTTSPVSRSLVSDEIATVNMNTFPVNLLNQTQNGSLTQQVYFSNNQDAFAKNDTLTFLQQFDDYFAYDDGSAEGAYYVTQYPSAPAYIATEYNLEVNDVLKGVQIYFPRQVPSGWYKEFFIQIYKSIAVDGAQDQLIYEQQGNFPEYDTVLNQGHIYPLDNGVNVTAGSYYVVIMLPAGQISENLHIGVDKNKLGANFRYIKTGIDWTPSLIDGALMIRPIFGNIPTSLMPSNTLDISWKVYPNPTHDNVNIHIENKENKTYELLIYNSLGQKMNSQSIKTQTTLPLPATAGTYFIQLRDGDKFTTQSIIKY